MSEFGWVCLMILVGLFQYGKLSIHPSWGVLVSIGMFVMEITGFMDKTFQTQLMTQSLLILGFHGLLLLCVVFNLLWKAHNLGIALWIALDTTMMVAILVIYFPPSEYIHFVQLLVILLAAMVTSIHLWQFQNWGRRSYQDSISGKSAIHASMKAIFSWLVATFSLMIVLSLSLISLLPATASVTLFFSGIISPLLMAWGYQPQLAYLARQFRPQYKN